MGTEATTPCANRERLQAQLAAQQACLEALNTTVANLGFEEVAQQVHYAMRLQAPALDETGTQMNADGKR